EGAEPAREGEGAGWVRGRALDHGLERQAEVQELRERRDQVVNGPVNVELVHVARDRPGEQLLAKRLLGDVEGKTRPAVAHVEVHAALDGRAHLGKNAPAPVQD